MDQTPHIVFLPTPGMGHLIPFAALADRLSRRRRLFVTFVTYAESASAAQTAFLASLPSSVASLSLPPVDLSDLPATARAETRISVAAARSVPALTAALRSIAATRNVVALVVDLFGGDSLDAAKAAGVPGYIFFPSNLMMLSLVLHLPRLDEEVSCEYRELPDRLKLPGCVPIPGPDLLSPIQDRSDDAYRWVLRQGVKYREAEGILVNTFYDIEPDAAEVLREAKTGWPPVYPVGPLINTSPLAGDGSECLRWLDKQPRASVIFVSFGSGGTLSTEQMTELALGLESSGQRFLWVVRSPSDKLDANYFDSQSVGDPFGFLPEGFVERIRNVGMLVPSWAPQFAILGHGATGGFLTHCGWNSTLESVACGVPMIAWPLYAEQRMNAVMLTEGVRIALRANVGPGGIVRREAIAGTVRGLMEGEEGREVWRNVAGLRAAAAAALAEDGKSTKALDEVVNKWQGL